MTALALVALALWAPVGQAVEPPGARIYVGLGAGVGVGTLSPEALAGRSAAQLLIRSGYAVSPRWSIGAVLVGTAQYNGWHANAHVASMVSSLMAEVTHQPWSDQPLHASVGAGWGSGLVISRLGDLETHQGAIPKAVADGGNGLSWMLGLRWDLTPHPILGLQARYDGAYLGRLNFAHTGALVLWVIFQ